MGKKTYASVLTTREADLFVEPSIAHTFKNELQVGFDLLAPGQVQTGPCSHFLLRERQQVSSKGDQALSVGFDNDFRHISADFDVEPLIPEETQSSDRVVLRNFDNDFSHEILRRQPAGKSAFKATVQ